MDTHTDDIAVAQEVAVAPDARHARLNSLAEAMAAASGFAVLGLLVAACVVGFAAVRRGLDLTDESYYILAAQHPRAYLRSSTEFQLLVGPILSFAGRVWVLRATKLVWLLAANAFFAWSFVTTAPALLGVQFRRFDRMAVGVAITAGALGVSVFLPQTPSYNDLTVAVLAAASGILLLLADHRFGSRAEMAAWSVVGALLWAQLLVKWPAVLALIPLFALVWLSRRSGALLRSAAAVAVGGIVAAALTQLLLAPLSSIRNGVRVGDADQRAVGGHNVQALLKRYPTDLFHLARSIGENYWYVLALALVAGALLAGNHHRRAIATVSVVALTLLSPVLIASGRARGGVEPYGSNLSQLLSRVTILPLLVTVGLILAVSVCIGATNLPSLRAILFLLALLAMPVLSAVGTANSLWFNAALAPTFWIAAALGAIGCTRNEYSRPLMHALAFAFVVLLAFTSFDGTWHHPYRQLRLASSTTSLHLSGPLDGLRVDPATADALNAVRNRAESADPTGRSSIVVWAGIPGLTVGSGLRQPIYPWLFSESLAERSLVAACQDRTRGIILLEYPSQPADLNGNYFLATACAGRGWRQLESINGIAVWSTGPPT